jgi:hypothetical protein
VRAAGVPFNITLFDKFFLQVDSTNDAADKPMIRYVIEMPKDTYLGVGYGTSMKNVDMLAFVASSTP